MKKTVACPVCGSIELTTPEAFEICHICGWEDDFRDDPDGPSTHPTLSLNQAIEAWKNGETIWPGYPNPKAKKNNSKPF